MLIPVSDVSVLAVYDLPSMYFTSFACSVGTTKKLPMKKENYNFIHEKAATNIQSLYAFGFFSIITQAFVN